MKKYPPEWTSYIYCNNQPLFVALFSSREQIWGQTPLFDLFSSTLVWLYFSLLNSISVIRLPRPFSGDT